MKIVREMLSPDGKYKSVIVARSDGLFQVEWQYWLENGNWQSTSASSSPQHLTESLDNAIKIGEEQLQILPGQELAGMTVNERLVVKGLEKEIHNAISSKDQQRAVAILVNVRLTEEQASQIVERIFNNPKYYGYKKK